MYAAFHGSVNSYFGAVGCNTLPVGTIRQSLLSEAARCGVSVALTVRMSCAMAEISLMGNNVDS